MNNLSKIITIIIILAIVGIGWLLFNDKAVEVEPIEQSNNIGGVITKNTDRGRIYSLFGTSSSSPLTFASSTADVTTVESPHTDAYTTSSVPFYVGLANLLTFSGNHYVTDATHAGSQITITIAGSNDNNCQNPVSGLNAANWSPLSSPSASNTPQSMLETSLETITLSASAVGDNIFSFTIENPNFNCVRLVATTASTTDDSKLYLEVSIQEN